MRPLRAALAAVFLVMAVGGRVVAAQDAWNDERTRTLVGEAIQRRALQLADTGLRDYTARAHGYLTFLAQLGEGFPDPPKVIKSDELVVEVYWGAPDRSKQRVVGRRDTLLLPTDINYHRDHLGIVQNDFPATIRLGDGDEVRDVPHPLSAAGLQVYDYRIADSLAIRMADRAIDVMMVAVRPKDDRVPAAVGAVYIDRVTASVVRMTFSFTRAALKDQQLEDVSVILENGLVDGRFWLPRRQEIEIRRSASWMDFPARGIIRGRWEICCVQPNVGLPEATFSGPEITEAPRAEQRAFPFEGTVMAGLPEEVRALDAEDVRRVQEDARELVRAGALARARSSSPAARGISDILRVNRVEGLAVGAGLTQRLGAGLSVSLGGRYGTADRDAKVWGSLGWLHASGFSVALTGRDDFADAGEVAEVSGLRNSIAAQEFGSDWTSPYGVRGGALRLSTAPRNAPALSLEFALEEHRPLAVHARPQSGRFEPTISADSLRLQRATLAWSFNGTPRASGSRFGFRWDLTAAHAEWAQTAETSDYLRASFGSEGRLALGPGQLAWRTIAAIVSPMGSEAPVQSLVYLGGPVTAPGYAFHSLVGHVGVSQRLEWHTRIPFVPLDLGRFGRVPSSLGLAPFAHAAWVAEPAGLGGEWYPSFGVGAIGLFDLLRLDVARTVRGSRWMFSIDVTRDLWPVL